MLKRLAKSLLAIIFFLPSMALAAESTVQTAAATESSLLIFYEKSFGLIGAIAGIIVMVIFWQISKKVQGNFRFIFRMFILALLLEVISSIAFALAGAGLIGDELSRYIERTLRLAILLFADIVALILFVRLNKNEKKQIQN